MPDENGWMMVPDWVDGIPPEVNVHDIEVLRLLARRVRRPGMVAVEVGSWVGNGSTRALAEEVRAARGRLYCVDTWAGSDNVTHHVRYRETYPTMFPVFAENVRRYGGDDVIRPLVLPSVSAARLFPDRSLDLVFIDGNHGYTAVRADLAAWRPKVRPGGLLCGHDYDADYGSFDAALRRETAARREDDFFPTDRLPGQSGFHPGVVAAVYERFGPAAVMWCRRVPSTVWSYAVPNGLAARLARWVTKPAALPEAPWPEFTPAVL
jgi:predicted O-methyltransferase YrrM